MDRPARRADGRVRQRHGGGIGSGKARDEGGGTYRIVPTHGQGGVRTPARGWRADTDLREEGCGGGEGLPVISVAGPGRPRWSARPFVSDEDG